MIPRFQIPRVADRCCPMKFLFFLALTFAVPLAITSCAVKLDPAGPYAGDKVLYATDASINAAYSVLDVFLAYELANRAALKQDVRDFANKVRREAPPLSKRILALRDVYALAPTAENKLALDTAIKLLRELLTQSTAYLVEKQT